MWFLIGSNEEKNWLWLPDITTWSQRVSFSVLDYFIFCKAVKLRGCTELLPNLEVVMESARRFSNVAKQDLNERNER